jgi:hypothetical protein
MMEFWLLVYLALKKLFYPDTERFQMIGEVSSNKSKHAESKATRGGAVHVACLLSLSQQYNMLNILWIKLIVEPCKRYN